MARSQGRSLQLVRGSRPFHNAIRLLALSTVVLALPAGAAKWEFIPSLRLEEIYTDNVGLQPPGSARSDWVTQVTPGLSINATGPGLKFFLNYTPEAYYYAKDVENNRVDQRLKALGNIELAKELLFVDAGANIEQVNNSLLGPITDSNVNVTNNRSTASTYFVSPYLAHNFGPAVRGELRWTGSKVDVSGDPSSGTPESDASRIDIKISSGPSYKLLTWSLAYNEEKIDYTDPTDLDTRTEVSTLNVRRLITPYVGFLASGGYEFYDSGIAGAESEGSKWSVGFDWAPSARTYLAATAGRRFYGNAYSFAFRLRTRLTTWGAAHIEEVTSTRSEFFVPATGNTSSLLDSLFQPRFPDPVARQKAVQDFLARTGLSSSLVAPVNFFSTQLYLAKTSTISGGILGTRHTLLANAFYSTRDVLVDSVVIPSTGDFVSSGNIRQTGTGAVWNWRVTPRNTINTNVGFVRNEFPGTSRVEDLSEVSLGITRQFQPRLSGSLIYRWRKNDSNQDGILYEENSVSAGILMRF